MGTQCGRHVLFLGLPISWLSPLSQMYRVHYVYSFIGPPIAFHAEWPPFMYFASNPASRSAIAVLQPTWNPYAQNTTTGSDFDSFPHHSCTRSGSRQVAPSMMSGTRDMECVGRASMICIGLPASSI